jgi:hypothetical protein
VNSTATPSRVEIPGNVDGFQVGDGLEGGSGNETENETVGNETGNVTSNETGNGTGDGTEPGVKTEGAGTEKKKKEGGLPGFEMVLVVIAGLSPALVRRRAQRRS